MGNFSKQICPTVLHLLHLERKTILNAHVNIVTTGWYHQHGGKNGDKSDPASKVSQQLVANLCLYFTSVSNFPAFSRHHAAPKIFASSDAFIYNLQANTRTVSGTWLLHAETWLGLKPQKKKRGRGKSWRRAWTTPSVLRAWRRRCWGLSRGKKIPRSWQSRAVTRVFFTFLAFLGRVEP